MKVAKRIYQLLLLLLPPDNRKKMCFLLQYLSNLIANKDLKFSSEMSNKEFVIMLSCEFGDVFIIPLIIGGAIVL